MREKPAAPLRRFDLTAIAWLIGINVAAFAFQQIDLVYLKLPVNEYLALSPSGLGRGFVWQLLSFQFLHAGLGHLLFNLLGLWMFGRSVEVRLGRRTFFLVYFLSGAVGGLLQVSLAWLFPNHFGSAVFGASAGVLALIAVFALMEPEAEILLFFVLPLKARHLLLGAFCIALFFTVVPSDPIVAHAAHLGGLVAGVAYVRWLMNQPAPWERWRRLRVVPRREPVATTATVRRPAPRLRKPVRDETPPAEFISQQIDPILDKISAHGIHSLTEAERRMLEAAKDRIGQRRS